MMSSLPECRVCGDYVHHGPVLCEKCMANVGELITALRRKSHKQGDAHVMRILYPNDPTHKTIYEQAKQQADAAEDSLRVALGVQRD